MRDGYHRRFRAVAAQQVYKPVDIPEPALGVGFAEVLNPIIPKQNLAPARTINYTRDAVRTSDDMIDVGTGKQFTAADFPVTGSLGGELPYA